MRWSPGLDLGFRSAVLPSSTAARDAHPHTHIPLSPLRDKSPLSRHMRTSNLLAVKEECWQSTFGLGICVTMLIVALLVSLDSALAEVRNGWKLSESGGWRENSRFFHCGLFLISLRI